MEVDNMSCLYNTPYWWEWVRDIGINWKNFNKLKLYSLGKKLLDYNLNLNIDESILKKRLLSHAGKFQICYTEIFPKGGGLKFPLKSELHAESPFQRGQDGKGREVTFPWGSQTSPATGRWPRSSDINSCESDCADSVWFWQDEMKTVPLGSSFSQATVFQGNCRRNIRSPNRGAPYTNLTRILQMSEEVRNSSNKNIWETLDSKGA